ncbi:hypothetical protein C0J52_07679 [Blattella germanica]|nr:hypothetical protein C0J52_07679 [Blattella germanica]
MPSAATSKLEKQASTEAFDPIRQAITVVEHKIRNLEKRKKKIEIYREEQKNGRDLNSDQLAAVAKYEEVQQTLEFSKDLYKQFNGIAVDAAKQQKKHARKEALERAQQELAKVKEILMIQDVLQNMGQENVREDFLAGRNGAALLGEEDLKYLDDLYSEVSPKHGGVGGEDGSPTFQVSIVEGKSKDIVGTTYAKLKELVSTIHACGYFDQVPEEVVEEQIEEVATEAEVITHEVVEEEEYISETPAIPPTDTFPQAVTSVSQPTSNLPIPSTMVAQSTAAVPTPVAAVESSYFSTAAPTFESELDSPDLSSMLTGTTQQNQHSTPPPSGPVAPIPTQTFTNQNFASVPTSNVPQQVCWFFT